MWEDHFSGQQTVRTFLPSTQEVRLCWVFRSQWFLQPKVEASTFFRISSPFLFLFVFFGFSLFYSRQQIIPFSLLGSEFQRPAASFSVPRCGSIRRLQGLIGDSLALAGGRSVFVCSALEAGVPGLGNPAWVRKTCGKSGNVYVWVILGSF